MGKRQRRRQRLELIENAPRLAELRSDLVDLDEAGTGSDGTIPIKVISPGWGTSGYYPAAVLERDGATAFPAGTQMFWDHPTVSEAVDPRGRSLRDLAATLATPARWDPNHSKGAGLYAEAKVMQPYREPLAEMAPHIGISIRAAGEAHTGEAEGKRGRIIDRLVEGHSVDFVAKAGRGGQVLALLESARAAAVTEAGLYNDDLRDRLRSELIDRYGQGDNRWCYVRDFNDENVVFDTYGDDVDNPGTWRLAYTLGADDNVVLDPGEPTEVKVTTTYTPTDEPAPLAEARNVGQWFEAQIHSDFTAKADDMFGNGKLTRDERIALSSGIGAALDAFTQTVEQNAPQLLTRDLWVDPTEQATVTETSQEDAMDITKEQLAEAVAKALDEKLTPIQEALTEATTKLEAAEAKIDVTETKAFLREARDHVEGKLRDVRGLPAIARTKIVESLVDSAAKTDTGVLDVAKLDEAFTTEVTAWSNDLGLGKVTGLGEGAPLAVGDTPTAEQTTAAESRVTEGFKRLGLNESSAAVATAGRR